MQEEAERIGRERQGVDEKPCRDGTTFRHPKPDDNDSDVGSGHDDGGGAAAQPDMAYEVTVKYRIVKGFIFRFLVHRTTYRPVLCTNYPSFNEICHAYIKICPV